MATLDSSLVDVLGGKTAAAFEKSLNLTTVGELLRHYPRRLAERGELSDLASLREGEDVTVMADVLTSKSIPNRYGGNRPGGGGRLEVIVSDGRGRLKLTFFGARQSWRARELKPGVRGLFAGKVGVFRGERQLTHPEYLLLRGGEPGGEPSGELGAGGPGGSEPGGSGLGGDTGLDDLEVSDFAGALIPVYPATKDLRTWTISSSVSHTLRMLDPVPDPLPGELRARRRLLDLDTALRQVHQPESPDQWYAAKHRLKWDEALGVQLVLAQRRAAAALHPATARPGTVDGLLAAFDARLPFELTQGQRDVGRELAAELAAEHPMHRLLQGEVGSGKTVVALRAMLQVVDSGGQAALLAPTEVLAAQHARSVESMLGELAQGGRLGGAERATRVTLLTGSLSAAARRQALLDAASGAAGIVIGTHALIQQHVQFADLALVVVDEQHRFGVEQRDALRVKAARPPHVLVMTATPIPRTVAMTVFGDLDTSTLVELPAGRSPIASTVIPVGEKPAWLDRAWQRIREEVAAGRQAYVVCPRIGDGGSEPDEQGFADDSRASDGAGPDESGDGPRPSAAVTEVLPELAAGPLAGLRLAALHGRLPPDQKDAVMRAFAAGELDVLVATTVIEVGVDVANATVMVILDAGRFGVSQLHQLRGRVGRGSAPGLCLLVTDAPPESPARERLDAVASTTDGFELARLDVTQRHEGDVLGAAQSGRRSGLRLLSLLTDEALIAQARDEANELIRDDPTLERHPLLAAQLAVLVGDEQAEYLEKG